MFTERLDKIIKWIIIVFFIIIMIESVYFKFGDCDKCKFKIDNKYYDSTKFMSLYSDKCFIYNTVPKLEIPKT